MRALLSTAPGGPETLRLGELPDPVAGAGEVVIDVTVCGVNFPDSLIIADKYQFNPDRPFAPGAEVAGIVAEVGPGVDNVAPGDRVMAMCGWGGMAEKVVVPAAACVTMPDSMSYAEGASFLVTFGTSYHALKQRGQLQAGERLLVLGSSGGVGLAAIALGRAMGAHVIATASSQEKLDFAMAHGAHEGFVYPRSTTPDEQKDLNTLIKDGAGKVDVVYDPVGGPWSEAAVRSLAWNGRLLVVGFPAGISRLPLNLLLLKGASAVGVFYGEFTTQEPEANAQNNCELTAFFEAGKVRPTISESYAFAAGGDAIEHLSSRRAVGKVVVEIGSGEGLE